MKIKLILTMLCFCIFFKMTTAFADDQTELKSKTVVTILALDPIPGDALFYAGKPIQGTINTIMGGIGGTLFWYGAIHSIVHTDNSVPNCNDLSCDDWSPLVDGLAMVGGGLLYLPALIWDGVGGVSGVENHNEKVQKKASMLSTFQPLLSINSKGGFVGGQFKF